MSETRENYFLQSVTRMGDRHAVISHREITSDSGLKLLATGSRITSAIYDKLLHHKLLPPLEQCLNVENSVDHNALIALVDDYYHNLPLQVVAEEVPQAWRHGIIRQIPLPPAIAFKLTVAREERDEIFQHSVLLMALTLYLCRHIGWDETETINAAAAALLHDIGILHLNPKLFENGRTMSLNERKGLYAHPLIGYLILHEFKEYPPMVAEAVRQHHERLDGSGYPQGLQRQEINRVGQLLGVAELLGSRFGHGEGCSDCASLDLILKLNSQRLNAEYALHLKPFFKAKEGQAAPRGFSLEHCNDNLLALTTLFADWRSLHEVHQPVDRGEAEQVGLIELEIQQLKKNLLQTGLVCDEHPEEGADTSWLPDDPEHLAEITFLLKEAGWQLSDLYYLLYRRWPKLNPSGALHNWIERLPRVFAR